MGWSTASARLLSTNPFVTQYITQRVADTTLRLSKPVKGRGVHIAYSGRPSGAHRRFRLLATDRHPGTAESRAAEAKGGHFESGASKAAFRNQ